MEFIYCNGELVPLDQAVLSPLDHGFLYGHGLFETLRVYDGHLFAFARHYARLQAGAQVLNWPLLPSAEQLQSWTAATLAANGLTDASVRITLSRGVGAPRPDPSSCGEPTVVIFAQAFQPPTAAAFAQGWKLKTTTLRRNEQSPLCRLKSANYLENLLAKAEAADGGAREALFFNTAGQLAEGTMSNIFLVEHREAADTGSGQRPAPRYYPGNNFGIGATTRYWRCRETDYAATGSGSSGAVYQQFINGNNAGNLLG